MVSTICIIVPVYNRLDVTRQGISYIDRAVNYYRANVNKAAVEVIIVDDGSTDGTGDWVRQQYPHVTVLTGDGSLWWTGAVNLGISYSLRTFSNLEAVILQNDDVMLEEDWLLLLLQAVDKNPNALIGCATALPDQKELIQYGGRELSFFAREKKLNYRAARSQFVRGFVNSSFDLYGRGLYIPVDVFQKIGLFDQKRFKHRGDMDIPLRAKKEGFILLVSYDAIVYELPYLTFNLDVKRRISIKDAYRLMTDFRSSSNCEFIYNYSRIATNNFLRFILFLTGNFFYSIRGMSWRLLRNYL